MNTSFKTLALSLTAAFALCGCPEQGPAEKAGEKIDEAAESVEEALTPDEGPMEKAGKKLDEAGETIKEKAEEAKSSIEETLEK